eukprot:TRINITY_DN8797_c0_g1_i1.p1 TRINITY_DN8797_c0_g1~~TRINITY_DN8797_c0_g1_i1.p1  ORF type:complete len:191 (+),score=34.38 TRINITY_DN8797_c0_g1_i1:64-636(+)
MVFRIACFGGSLRKGSTNAALLRLAAQVAASKGGSEFSIEVIEPEKMRIPLVDTDLETVSQDNVRGYPLEIQEWRERIANAHGLIIATPEYNFSVAGVVKNVIDWVSRPPNAFAGKVALMLSSGGGVKGTNAINHLRPILSGLGTQVLAEHVGVSAFSGWKDGELVDQDGLGRVDDRVEKFLKMVKALSS